MDRVSSCNKEGESAECGRVSCRRVSSCCGSASAQCGRVSLACSSMMFSNCRRVSECEESEFEEKPELE